MWPGVSSTFPTRTEPSDTGIFFIIFSTTGLTDRTSNRRSTTIGIYVFLLLLLFFFCLFLAQRVAKVLPNKVGAHAVPTAV